MDFEASDQEVPVLPAHLPYLPGIVLLIPEHQDGLLGIAWGRDGEMRTSSEDQLSSEAPRRWGPLSQTAMREKVIFSVKS